MSTDMASSDIKTSEEYALSGKGSCIGAVLPAASFSSSYDSMIDPCLGTFAVRNQMSNEKVAGRFCESYTVLYYQIRMCSWQGQTNG
jgi:hypothetical protein